MPAARRNSRAIRQRPRGPRQRPRLIPNTRRSVPTDPLMPTEFRYTDEQLRLAARLYYIDGMGQTEVARFVNVSQSKVSRLLAQARERGIVRISVAEYEPRHSALEQR